MNPGAGTTSDLSHYRNDIDDFTHIIYSFLTLSPSPNPNWPPEAQWDGNALYETMTLADVTVVLDNNGNNPHDWQRTKIEALIDAVYDNNGKFIWAIGGWSDLT